jgi:hypothetical protein
MEEYRKYEDKDETCVTIISYSLTSEKLIENLEQTLESCSKISNSKKKNVLCNTIFSLKERIMNSYEPNQKINSIYFYLMDESVKGEYILKESEINVLNEYGFKNFIYRNESRFPIDELKDIFTNFDFLQIIQLNQQNFKHMKMNRYKQKELMIMKVSNDTQVIETIERIKKEQNMKDQKIIIYGQSQILNQLKTKIVKNTIINDENMTREEIWKLNEDEKMRDNLRYLEEKLEGLNNEKNIDLYVFGRIKKEIAEHIENYMLKELFIEERKIEILKTCVSEETLNFKIIPIRSLENGDIGDEFIKKYNGLMGLKYY